jgi:4-diphosphocytidyl-2-C-methyl-D-erythritol kinase
MRETAPAKLNLALHVRGREADGYHRIETVFAFVEYGDELSVAPGDGLTLTVTGPFAGALEGEGDNLVLRAARALAAAAGVAANAALTLDKRLPVASGIGGGSADAAAALRLLRRFWRLDKGDERLAEIAGMLGADVPACLAGRTMRGEGRGDRLTPLDLPNLAGTPVLLVNPRVAVPTAAVYRGWDGVDRGPLIDWDAGRNDLEPPARRRLPARPASACSRASRPAMPRRPGSRRRIRTGGCCRRAFADRPSPPTRRSRIGTGLHGR